MADVVDLTAGGAGGGRAEMGTTAALDKRIALVEAEIGKLREFRQQLVEQRSQVQARQREQQLQDAKHWQRIVHAQQAKPFAELDRALEILRTKFGMQSFRELQLDAIKSTVNGADTFCVMPTGGGKSLCFQLPAVLQGGLTVAVSPLLSLSHDQVLSARAFGIDAAMLSGELEKEEVKRVYACIDAHLRGKRKNASQSNTSDDVADPGLALLYVTPEMVVKSKRLLGRLEKVYECGKLTRIVIDEAHCASTQGHDFRPDYQKLFILRRQFPTTPIMCCTATATRRVETDVKALIFGQANAASSVSVRGPVDRSNIEYHVLEKPTGDANVATFVFELLASRFRDQCGIIYCHSRRQCEALSFALNRLHRAHVQQVRSLDVKAGISATKHNFTEPYHAYLAAESKVAIHNSWKRGNVRVICGTSAFGMGIDKPDVRFVIHETLPVSMEAFMQQSGRAGRDSRAAQSIVLYRRADVARVGSLVSGAMNGMSRVLDVLEYAENRDRVCRRVHLARAFDQQAAPRCDRGCDVCQRAGANSGEGSEEQDHAAESQQKRSDEAGRCVLAVLRSAAAVDKNLTFLQLCEAIAGRGAVAKKLVSEHRAALAAAVKGWKMNQIEQLVIIMLLEQFIHVVWTHNAYTTNTYLAIGPLAFALEKGDLHLEMAITSSPCTARPGGTTDRAAGGGSRDKGKEQKKRKRVPTGVVELCDRDDDDDDDSDFVD